MKNLFKISILFIAFIGLLACGEKQPDITGQWKGAITAQKGMLLNLVFDIKKQDGKLTAIAYSINQSGKGIDVENIDFKKDSIEIKMPAIMAMYNGKLIDGKFIGIFRQGPASFPMDLEKMEEGFFNAEANDKPNDLYTSTDVKFENKKAEGVTLAGTITIPKEGADFPAVVLVTGSGAQNRDEEIMGHKPFKRIADYLSSRGIVVLRYDDRGFAESTGDLLTSTTEDFCSDAVAAVDFLKTYPNVNSSKIGIIGHSEGGLISFMAAAQNNVDFIVSLAGPTMTGEEISLLQAEKIGKAMEVNSDTLNRSLALNKAIFTIVKNVPDNKKAKLDIIATIKHYALDKEMEKDVNAEMMANTVLNPWYRYFLAANPADYFPKIKCPTLLLFGEKDLQVPAIENEETFYKIMKNKIIDNFTLITIANVNHLFQKADKGVVSEYSNLDNAAMNDETLDVIYNWMLSNIMQ